jgi:hypothetical protein
VEGPIPISDWDEAMKYRFRAILVVLALVLGLAACTESVPPHETYSKYGFSVDYPAGMGIRETGEWGVGTASEVSGQVQFSFDDPPEAFGVVWVTVGSAPDLGAVLDEAFSMLESVGTEVNDRGVLLSVVKDGHEVAYQDCTCTEQGLSLVGIIGAFYCDEAERVYVPYYAISSEVANRRDQSAQFQRFLDSLVCHGATPAAPPTPTPALLPPSAELEKLLVDVFDPQPGEKVVVMVDLPRGELADYEGWAQRREMAAEWHSAFRWLEGELGISVHRLLTYPATGAHNGPLPAEGKMDGQSVRIEEILADTNIVVALTEYSATAPLIDYTHTYPNLRAASMPMVSKSMEATALSADYSEVARRAHVLRDKLDQAEGASVVFSTGHEMYFDLRHREAHADDGQLHADKEGARVINLPSGEAYMAPYEGELEGEPSRTQGTIPVMLGDELVLARVEENRIVEVIGDSPEADEARDHLAMDDALRNVAELGLGCNDKAVITGNVLEDEKVMGMHWANGLSDHIGGTVRPEDFSDPSHIEHRDWVYPKGGAIEIASLVLEYEDGTSEEIIKDGQYAIF